MSSDENSENLIYGCGSNGDELGVSKIWNRKIHRQGDQWMLKKKLTKRGRLTC